MRVGIMGAGAIGCFVGGRLVADRDVDVTFIGRPRLAREISAHGLRVQELGSDPVTVSGDRVMFDTEPARLTDADVVLCCVKSAHTAGVAATLAEILPPHTVVVSLQNGIRNAAVLREHLGERPVVAGIVGFNVISRADGLFQRTTTGPLSLESCEATHWRTCVSDLRASHFDVEEHSDIAPHQWTKLLVNLNNAVSALSGAPTRDLILVPGYRRIVASLIEEGARVLRTANIQPSRLRGAPIGLMVRVLRGPTFLVRLFTRGQVRIDPNARSSMYEDLVRGRPTEVDYLNGEIVALAERVGASAPLNRRIVELVHDAERAGPGTPGLGAASLWSKLSG